MSSVNYFGGCEGGSSHSVVTIIDSYGNVVGEASGEGTNQWLVGMDECLRRIQEMISNAKEAAGLGKTVPLDSLGLSLSGADDSVKMKEISEALLARYPFTSKLCFTCNDCLSPLVTGTDGGGVVLISGTGSNCLTMNPSGSTANCGGWGHMIGDKGSAYWIAIEAIKTVYEDFDGFERSPFSTEFLKKAIFEYFKMTDMFGILPHLYPANNANIDKKQLAKFCVEGVVNGAESNDKLSLHILYKAGEVLGKHVKALIPKMEKELLLANGGLKIICVGSVWKSWTYLKDGFLKGLAPQTDEEKQLKEFTLLKLKRDARASVGAAAWGARKGNFQIRIDHSKMTDQFFSHCF